MRLPAARGRPDANQSEIIEAYETLGCSVIDLHAIGFGTPDLLVGYGHRAEQLVEVKAKSGRLRGSQKQFFDAWRGPKPVVVRTVEDVHEHVKQLREKANES